MNLALDIGNTAVKWATFEGRTLVESGKWRTEDVEWKVGNIDKAMACVSGNDEIVTQLSTVLGSPLSTLIPDTPLPIRIDYKTPETLGADRMAAACGACALHPGEACLVVDAGTCITVDFVDAAGTYHGGAIMPGIRMKLEALHNFTAHLPLLNISSGTKAPVLGRSTDECIVAGTLGATLLALAGFVACYKAKEPALQVLLTGGDAALLAAGNSNDWEVVPDLTLIGLNEIMMYNE